MLSTQPFRYVRDFNSRSCMCDTSVSVQRKESVTVRHASEWQRGVRIDSKDFPFVSLNWWIDCLIAARQPEAWWLPTPTSESLGVGSGFVRGDVSFCELETILSLAQNQCTLIAAC